MLDLALLMLAVVPQHGTPPTPAPDDVRQPVAPEVLEREPVLPEALDALDEAITAEELYAHVKVLASDEANGRFTGTPGAAFAAEYLAGKLDALRAHGLEPAGDVVDPETGARGWYQDVEMTRVAFEELPTMAVDDMVFPVGTMFRPLAGYDFHGELELVRADAGGVRALEPRTDAALFLDMPAPDARALYDELGAEWQKGWGALLERGATSPGRAVTGPERIWWVRAPARPLRLEVRAAARAELQAAAPGTRVRLDIGGSVGKAFNLVAKLPATTTQEGYVSEAVVLSAHYDHLKSLPVEDGEDGIFNGADDDASGVAAVVEILEALALSDAPRGRDVVMLLATGEEIGLVGTSYYLDHPVVPLERTVFNLNFEMIGRPDEYAGPVGTLWLTGYVFSTFGADLTKAGVAVVDDPRPSQRFFQRSDNYAFVLKGVVGQSLSSFNLHEDYHTVNDEADTLDYEHMQLGTEAGLAATRMLLEPTYRVTWVPEYTPPRR